MLTFWQGLFLAVISAFSEAVDGEDEASSENDHKSLQNFLICLEMFLASIMMMFAFPWREYRLIAPPEVCEGGALRSILRALRHATRVGDVFQDTYHQFATRYQTYILPPTDDTYNMKARSEEEQERIRSVPAPDSDIHTEHRDGTPSRSNEFVFRANHSGDGGDAGVGTSGAPPAADGQHKKSKRISGVFLTKEQRKHTEKQQGHAVRTFLLKGQEMRGVRNSLSTAVGRTGGEEGQGVDAQRMGASSSSTPCDLEAGPGGPDDASSTRAAEDASAPGGGDMIDEASGGVVGATSDDVDEDTMEDLIL